MALRIRIKQLDDDLPLPENAYEGDGAVDLRSTIDCALAPFERKLIPSGIAIELPARYAALVVPRSGLAIKHGITLVNSPGLIDSNYRGEIGVILANMDANETFEIKKGDRIAQLMIIEVQQPEFQLSDTLSDTQRGTGGFGSSGVSN